MEKKEYTAPQIVVLGEVQDITQGEGWQGNDDGVWIFRWGTNPTGS